MKPDKSIDRRVARTQRLLHEALISLILERGWNDVSVREVCERADVGRSTFYVHFGDKEELLLSGFALFRSELQRQVKTEGTKPLAFVPLLIAHVHSHRRLWRALVGKQCGPAVQKRLSELIAEMLERELAETVAPGPRRSAAVRYMAGAFLQLLVWWLDARSGLDVGELEELLCELTRAVLAQAKRGSLP